MREETDRPAGRGDANVRGGCLVGRLTRSAGARPMAAAIAVVTVALLGAGDDTANAPSTAVLELPALPDVAPIEAASPGPAGPLGAPLVPGQMINPIDLAGALRLAGARDLDIAIARERVAQALAELGEARALWLPSLFIGPNWIRHDGQAQLVEAPVRSIRKS